MVDHVTDADFEEKVLKSDVPVLVDFWAEWCAPCRMIAPVLDEIASEMDGRLKVVKLNVDENPNAPAQYGVRGIPTLLLVKDGQVVAQQTGAAPKNSLVAWINNALGVS